MTGEKYENYTKIVMNDEKDRSSGQNSKSDQYITICHKDGKSRKKLEFLSDIHFKMEDEVYSNRLPNEAIRVISENDPGFKMML